MDSLYYADWKWAALRGILHSLGRASDGIALGLARGFDSGESMEYIYRNQPSGRWGIGWLADLIYLQQVGCRGLRGRKQQMQDALRAAIRANRAAGQPTHVLDVAAGPADYLLEVFAQDGGGDLSAECRDLDNAGLARGRQRGAALTSRVSYVHADALDPAAFAVLDPRPNVAIASGFYEILLSDEQVRRSLRLIATTLPSGGTLIFTTQVQHPQLAMIAQVCNNRHGEPWIMTLRSAEQVASWAIEVGFVNPRTTVEPLGLFTVTTMQRA